MDEDILAMLLTALVTLTVVGGFVIRFSLKPIVDSIARLLEVRTNGAGSELLERRIALLEQELQLMKMEQSRFVEEQEFEARLQR